MIICIVLVGGAIGCGKTFLINFLKEHSKLITNTLIYKNNSSETLNKIKNNSYTETSFCYIAFDDLCSISEQAELIKTQRGWKSFRSDLLKAVEYFISSFNNLSDKSAEVLSSRSILLLQKLKRINPDLNSQGNTVIFIEDNFYYRSMRYEWFQIAKHSNLGFCQIILRCSLNTAINRNKSRGYQIPEDKIEKVFSILEYPEPQKYKWEENSLIINSSEPFDIPLLNEIINLIQNAIDHPVQTMIHMKKTEAQKICSMSLIHQSDNILRKLTSKKILFLKGIQASCELKKTVPFIVNLRQELLKDLKHGLIYFPPHILDQLETEGISSVEHEVEDILSELFEKSCKEKINFL